MSPPAAPFTTRWFLWRLGWGIAVASLVSAVYFEVALLTAGRTVFLMTPLDETIPFIPWTWWVYFPGYVASLTLATVGIRDDRLFFRALLGGALAQCIAACIYLLIPSTFPRPTAADLPAAGLTREAILWFWSLDPPNNTFPSTHVAISTVGALALWREKSPLRFIALLLVAGIFITVHTAKQHYWIDAVAGVLLGVAVFRLSLQISRG